MPNIRIARKQSEKKEFEDFQQEEGRLDYNIWYHKYVGQRRDISKKTKKVSKCVIARDAGWTKGCDHTDAYFCLYFARGICSLGGDCTFLHRLPTSKDEERIQITRDCFGREKHATDREDMGGVGSFNRESKILYVGGLKNVSDLDSILIKNFKEWGQLDYVRVVKDKCYAFIKYKLRLCAEFAKEAMDGFTIPGASFVLDIRWATEDPDDLATKRLLMTRKQIMIDKVQEKGISITNDVYPSIKHQVNESDNEEINEDTNNTKGVNDKNNSLQSVNIYSDYYKKFFPELYETMKEKIKAEMLEKIKLENQQKSEEKPKNSTQKTKEESSNVEDLSYETYMHRQLKEATVINKRKREEEEEMRKRSKLTK